MPALFRRLWSRLLASFTRPSDADGLDEEISGHLRLLQQRYEAQGLPPDEARREARSAFGGVEQLREQLQDQQSFPWFDALRQDVRYAIRTIVRTPVVSLAVIVTFWGIALWWLTQMSRFRQPERFLLHSAAAGEAIR